MRCQSRAISITSQPTSILCRLMEMSLHCCLGEGLVHSSEDGRGRGPAAAAGRVVVVAVVVAGVVCRVVGVGVVLQVMERAAVGG